MELTNAQKIEFFARAYIALIAKGDDAKFEEYPSSIHIIATIENYAATLEPDHISDANKMVQTGGGHGFDIEQGLWHVRSEDGRLVPLNDAAKMIDDDHNATVVPMPKTILYTATVKINLDEPIVDCQPIQPTDKLTIEVGGTCDQGKIVAIDERSLVPPHKLWIIKNDRTGAVGFYLHHKITNYKPPVRIPCWHVRCNLLGDDRVDITLIPGLSANGYTVTPGYFTPSEVTP